METYHVVKNKTFVGREFELNQLKEVSLKSDSKIIVVYGRRRVGKTELLEQFFSEKGLLRDRPPPIHDQNLARHKLRRRQIHNRIRNVLWCPHPPKCCSPDKMLLPL